MLTGILIAVVSILAISGDEPPARPVAKELPTVTVRADDTEIKESCRVVIPEGTVIEDRNDNGVIRIAASDVVVEFAKGSVLRGAKPGVRPDEYKGYGIRLEGRKNVTIRGARVEGYWGGLWATKCDGLTLEDVAAVDCRRAYLKSTPVAEDGGDWLSPHSNDQNEYLTDYGAAIYIEDSRAVTVRRCRVRDTQNGLCLDRVSESRVYDNDFSFLSGWGIAMWRASKNVITRNAVDFCVRGYSHGVYNRGQDSAGFIVFEQCNENVIAENSVTHGGDGFFGFGGREALGEAPAPSSEFDYKRRGCNGNLLINNDFSYAPAHGIEHTFSFDNKFIGNRLVGNAICGVWGGYSQDTLIAGNQIEDNGQMGYGLERGGVNIEHGRNNQVLHNQFKNNICGVHFWWDEDPHFAKKPWALVNDVSSRGNVIAANTFEGDKTAFHFRGVGQVTLGANQFKSVGKELEADEEHQVEKKPDVKVEEFKAPEYPVFGETRPVGARKALWGRENIVMMEWGPWDHASPLVRVVETKPLLHRYDLRKMPAAPEIKIEGDRVRGKLNAPLKGEGPFTYEVTAAQPGVHPYRLRIRSGDFQTEVSGTLLAMDWDATFFKWTKEVDPRKDLEGWRKLAQGDTAESAKMESLTLKYGFGGPSDQKISEAVTQAKLGGDYFGMVARAKLSLAKGEWKVATMSDDGVRVTVDGKPVIEAWSWHTPQRDEGTFKLDETKTVEILVEHFEIDGFATLEFELMPAK